MWQVTTYCHNNIHMIYYNILMMKFIFNLSRCWRQIFQFLAVQTRVMHTMLLKIFRLFFLRIKFSVLIIWLFIIKNSFQVEVMPLLMGLWREGKMSIIEKYSYKIYKLLYIHSELLIFSLEYQDLKVLQIIFFDIWL